MEGAQVPPQGPPRTFLCWMGSCMVAKLTWRTLRALPSQLRQAVLLALLLGPVRSLHPPRGF